MKRFIFRENATETVLLSLPDAANATPDLARELCRSGPKGAVFLFPVPDADFGILEHTRAGEVTETHEGFRAAACRLCFSAGLPLDEIVFRTPSGIYEVTVDRARQTVAVKHGICKLLLSDYEVSCDRIPFSVSVVSYLSDHAIAFCDCVENADPARLYAAAKRTAGLSFSDLCLASRSEGGVNLRVYGREGEIPPRIAHVAATLFAGKIYARTVRLSDSAVTVERSGKIRSVGRARPITGREVPPG